jgi:hypothetical protein
MKTQLSILAGTIAVLSWLSPAANAQAPLRVAGDGILVTITSGTLPLAASGYALILAANSDISYQTIGIFNVADNSGTYFYQAITGNSGNLVLNDATHGLIDETGVIFATPGQGSFSCVVTYPPKYNGASQAGTFKNAYGTAPASIAGTVFHCAASDGQSPFAKTGSFTMTFPASGPAYTVNGVGGVKVSSGTYSYSSVNRSTAAIRLNDSASGISTMYVGFSGYSGFYAISQSVQGGFQVGSFTASDTAPPVVAITTPAAGQRVPNSVFTVQGTARDSFGVAEVWCLANGVWGLATTTNGWTNWLVDVPLVAGTNVVSAYAVDAAGNPSATNSVRFMGVPGGQLALQAFGQGTITPNYSNAWLQIGQSYTMMASGVNGHVFTRWVVSTNWGEGVAVTNATLNFLMESNLAVQACFTDVIKPTLTITSPTRNQRLSSSVITVKGTVKENGRVAAVWCQTNGVWGSLTAASDGSSWTVDFVPVPGTNVVKVCALDTGWNWSATQSVSFVYTVTDRLKVQATGPCTMSPDYSNAVLELGKRYTTTVKTGKGYVLSNWVGSVLGDLVFVGSAPKLTFTMRSNLVLQANIIANPFIPAKGTYNGLFSATRRTQESSGSFTLALTDSGSYSGSARCGAKTYPFAGQFDVAGAARQVVSRTKTNAWVLGMGLDFAAQQVRGWVSNAVSDGWVADLQGDRRVFDTRTNPAAQYAGKYTLSIPGATNENGTVWLGDGYLVLSVDAGGKMTYSGSLADGSSIGPTSVPVSGAGNVALYAPLYSGKGSVWSWLAFDTNQPATAIGGWLSWIRLPQAGSYYRAGLTNEVTPTGTRYTPPLTSATRVIELTNGVVIFEGGNLGMPLVNTITLKTSNKVIDLSLTNKLSLSLSLANGTFSGSVREPGMTRSNWFKGVLLQDAEGGYGYFLESDRSGRVTLLPLP